MKHPLPFLLLSLVLGCDSSLPTEEGPASVRSDLAAKKAPTAYEMTVLGTLGGDYASAYAINNAGAVAGYSEVEPGTYRDHAFVWDAGNMIDLGTLGGRWSRAFGISNSGFVVGESEIDARPRYHAFRWRTGQMLDLGTLGGDYSSANSVNDQGAVAGASHTSAGELHATLWTRKMIIDLGTLGGDWSNAYGINSRGWVVGSSRLDGTDTQHAFLWRDGEMVDLGTLGGSSSSATDVNDAGEVTGTSGTAEGLPHAFIWRNGIMTDLGPSNPGRGGWGMAITNQGIVVGSSNAFAFPSQHAFVWTKGGPIDLPLPGWSNANDVNQRGQIVGYGGDAWPYQALLWRLVR